MSFLFFLKKSFFLFMGFIILLIILSIINDSRFGVLEAWAGFLIAFGNFLACSAILSWGFNRSDKQFYASFFGGMVLRFIVMFLALFILIKCFKFEQIVLVVSLLFTYFCFLIIEVWCISQFAALRGR